MTSPEVFSIGVKELLDQAKRLGLIPTYRQGTVLLTTTPGIVSVMVTLDNDTMPSRCYNYAGQLTTGDRVLVLAIRPQGLYVLGASNVSAVPNSTPSNINKAGPAVADTTTSAAYVSMTDTFSVTFTKNRADTRLEIDMVVSCFLSVAGNTKPSFAAQVSGTDYEIVAMLINPISQHSIFTGKVFVPGIAAGALTIQGRWRRVAGTGQLNRNTDDWVGLTVREVF